MITELIDNFETELELAELYTKNYLIYNMKNEDITEKFKLMAKEALNHCKNIQDLIFQIQDCYTFPGELIQVLNRKNNLYNTKKEWIESLLK